MTKDMTSGNPLKIILLFSIPVLMGNLFQQFYAMVDTLIVGRFLGENAFAAVGLTGSLVFLVLGFANGIGQGFGVMISQAFGAKDYKLLRHFVAVSMMLTAIVSLLLTLPTVAHSKDFLIMMHTPSNLVDLSDNYIKVIFGGILFSMSYNVAAGILRGIGDSRTPLFFLIFSSLLNIVLDLVLIILIPLGTAGAAYATLISQAVSAILCYIYMFKHYDVLKLSRSDFYFDFQSVFKLLYIGIPMAINYSITAVGCIIFQRAVNGFGSEVVASYAAATKVHAIATQSMPTLGTAMATYCGQNLGAGKYDRIFKGMRIAFVLCIIISGVAAVINCFAGPYAIPIFCTESPELAVTNGMIYLRTASKYLLPLAWIFTYRNALQGLNRGLMPMLGGVVELLGRSLAIALLADKLGYLGVCYADPAAWLLTGVMLIISYIVWKHRTIYMLKKQEQMA